MAEVGAKDVDLLSYWMPFLRGLKEFKEIAKAEEPELRYILEARERALRNFFIEDADEWGISRFEAMMGITPNAGDSLEVRRWRVYFKWTDYVPYTERVLRNRLTELCGDNYELDNSHYRDYLIGLVTHIGAGDIYELVSDLLVEMLPCNLVLDFQNILEALSSTGIYTAGQCCTAMGYCITQDINAQADLTGPFNTGMTNSTGFSTVIVNGIDEDITITAPFNSGATNSTGFSTVITQDADFGAEIAGNTFSGVGMGQAFTQIITQDINAKADVTGNTAAGNAISVGTTKIITE